MGILQTKKLDKPSLGFLLTDVLQKSKFEKRKRKTTVPVLMKHDLLEAVLQMLG